MFFHQAKIDLLLFDRAILISTFPKAPLLMFRLDPNAGMKLRQSNSMALSTNYNYKK